MIYNQENTIPVPDLDFLTYIFESGHSAAQEDTPLFAEAKHPERPLTKAKVVALTKQIAYFLRHQYGIGSSGPSEDVVVTVSTGQCALPCLFYATIAAEGIYSSASYAATESDLTRQAKDGPARVIICSKDRMNLAIPAARAVGLPRKNVLILESYPEVKLYSADGSVRCDFKGSLQWRRITDPRELEKSKICILYSSGTTGLPKGVLVSHTNLVSSTDIPSKITRSTWKKDKLQLSGRTLAHLPTAHIGGVMSYFARGPCEGRLVYWMPTFNMDDFLKYCGELQITSFFTVPPILIAIARYPAVKDQFRPLAHVLTGAAPMSRDHQVAVGKKLPVRVDMTWGMTETTGGAVNTPIDRDDVLGSLGTLMANCVFRLVDDDGNDVAPGQAGEGLIKGPVVTQGYHNNPEANKNAFTADGWLKTGDIFKIERGLIYIELIKYKGNQVAPAELEGILMTHPAILDAGVIGIQRDDTEVPRAFVALAADAVGKVSEADIVDWMAGKVASHKKLRGGVRFVDAVPRNPAGKVLRRELRMLQKGELKL